MFLVASLAPYNSRSAGVTWFPARLFIQTSLIFLFFQSVNRLTLYPLDCSSRKLFSSWLMGRSRYTTCDISKVGSRSSVTLVTTPSAPKPTTAPEKRSEEHTSELQSRPHIVCRLLLEKTK